MNFSQKREWGIARCNNRGHPFCPSSHVNKQRWCIYFEYQWAVCTQKSVHRVFPSHLTRITYRWISIDNLIHSGILLGSHHRKYCFADHGNVEALCQNAGAWQSMNGRYYNMLHATDHTGHASCTRWPLDEVPDEPVPATLTLISNEGGNFGHLSERFNTSLCSRSFIFQWYSPWQCL